MKRRSTSLALFIPAAVVVLALCVGPALAGTCVWTGMGPTLNWSKGANWGAGAAPRPGDDLVFPAAGSGPVVNTLNDFPAV